MEREKIDAWNVGIWKLKSCWKSVISNRKADLRKGREEEQWRREVEESGENFEWFCILKFGLFFIFKEFKSFKNFNRRKLYLYISNIKYIYKW